MTSAAERANADRVAAFCCSRDLRSAIAEAYYRRLTYTALVIRIASARYLIDHGVLVQQPPAASSERLADIRVGDLEREATVTSLRRHTAEGRLDLVEFEQRITNAYYAKTQTKLDLLLADLPAAPATTLRPTSRRPARWRRVSTTLRTVAAAIALLGMLSGHWTPNQAPQLASLFGVMLMTRSRVVLVIGMLATLGGQTTARANPAAPIVFLAVIAALTWRGRHDSSKRATG